jgi:hypothetical protein
VTDPHFHAFHVVGGLLRSSAGRGSRYTFQLPGIEAAFAAGLQNGDQITVEFHQQPSSGALVADSLSYYGATTMSGTVTSVGADSLTVAGADGSVTTFSLGPVPSLAAGVQPGDTVTVSSTFVNGTPVAHSVMITATGSYPIEPATTTATKTTTSPSTGPVVLRQPRG